MLERMYWNRTGAEQSKYDEMVAAGFQFTKKTEQIFRSYYRYFNDGDFPGWARGNWHIQRYGRWGLELNDSGLVEQEQRITDAILYEYARFQKKGAK